MGSIKITLETLYDIFRNEKKREDLQKLEDSFFLDVILYLQEKQALVLGNEQKENIFAAGEREKLDYELRSIKRILKEIYEKREKKIIDIALNKSKTDSDIIDTSSMLKEEKLFYEQILSVLDNFRKNILFSLYKTQIPSYSSLLTPGYQRTVIEPLREIESESGEEAPSTVSPTAPGMARVRFIHPVPSFIWKDKKVYGPFDIGEELEIYPEVAQLLIRKGRAEKV